MAQVKGQIQKVETKEWQGKTFYSYVINGTKYGLGAVRPQAGVGDTVEFDAAQNDKGFWNITNAKYIKKVEGGPPAPTSLPAPAGASGAAGGFKAGNSRNWDEANEIRKQEIAANEARQPIIVAQNVLGHAIKLVEIADAKGLKSKGDGYSVREKYVIEQADRLHAWVMGKMGGTGAKPVSAAQAAAAADKFEDDELPE
jgi:mono/diheme cytochrome c family protein